MNIELQWAKANVPAEGKDEDTVFVHTLPANRGLLLGVADGISTGNGRHAAQWVASAMSELASRRGAGNWTLRDLHDKFIDRLAAAARESTLEDSHSTLSCGIARVHGGVGGPYVRFDFFAVGDSPIWRVVRPTSQVIDFQASVAYGPPVPSEIAGLYSWVNLGKGRIEGQAHFGSVEVAPGELLIVATDGVPESRVLIEDQDRETRIESPRLIARLLESPRIDDLMLTAIMRDYAGQHLLVDDDASLAVVRLVWPFTASSESSAGPPRNSMAISSSAPSVTKAPARGRTRKARAPGKKNASAKKRSAGKKRTSGR